MEVHRVHDSSGWKAGIGKILLRCEDCDSIKTGSEWIIQSNLSFIAPPAESYLTDFQSYYNNIGIYYQQYLDERDLIMVDERQNNSLLSLAHSVNAYFKDKLKSRLKPENFAIANALILGNKSELGRDTRELYANSGIMHILAVSGLHVGIVYLILQSIFGFLKRNTSGRILFFIVTTLLLWSYAFVTGLSVSVIRASIMFTLFLGSTLVDRKNYSLNAAALSAIIMLIYNPNSLFDISFQLSYAAVFSIILFYHTFYNLFHPGSAVVRFFWQISCISIAVQLGTFPITIYYFHHFQPFFVVYNLFAIPFAFCTLLMGLCYIITSSVPFVSDALAFALNFIIDSFNTIISKLYEVFPGTNFIRIEAFEIPVFALIVFSVFGFLYRKQLGYFVIFVLCLAVISVFHSKEYLRASQQSGIKNFTYPSSSSLIYAGNQYHWMHSEDSLRTTYKSELFIKYSKLTDLERQLHKVETEDFELLVSHGKSVMALKNVNFLLPENFKTDYLILPEKCPAYAKKYYSRFTNTLVSK